MNALRRIPALAVLGLALLAAAFLRGATPATPAAPLPAFPGAEGFGAHTPGGRGGRVIAVTSLASDGPGSLRAAVQARGPRIIVFRVGGLIDMQGGIAIDEPFVTIAGQTAPGDGICLANGSLVIRTHDVVLRHLRVRVGDGPTGGNPENRDALGLSGSGDDVYNIVVDHCSFSWALDENVQTWRGPRDITIQWSITSESLLDSLHPKGRHGKGMILGSEDNTVTVHHTLFAHNHDRNPLSNSGGTPKPEPAIIDFRNNIIYNYERWPEAAISKVKWMNYVGNTVVVGGGTSADRQRRSQPIRNDGFPNQRLYLHDNVWPGQPDQVNSPWPEPIPVPPVTTQRPAEAVEAVLRFAGATLPVRDVVDARVIEEVRTGTGAIIHTQSDVGGWAEYLNGNAPVDRDEDGMPDEWERRYDFNPNDPSDGPADADGDGYTNVEEYLNGTDPRTHTPVTLPEQRDPVVQGGNEHLRFGEARKQPTQAHYDPAAREAFVKTVRASGREVAEFLGLRFVSIPPGKFDRPEEARFGGPVPVTLTKPYQIGAYEITQEQWVRVMGTKPWLGRPFAKDAPDHPATYVTYHDAQEFIARLNACGDARYRLPTEAEWEWARLQDSVAAQVTVEDLGEYAWNNYNTVRAGQPHPQPVGGRRGSSNGLYDMVGNVHEWCHDSYFYWYWRRGGQKVDPMGPGPDEENTDGYRVLQGGSFFYTPQQLLQYPTSAHRPEYRNFDVGFRLMRQ